MQSAHSRELLHVGDLTEKEKRHLYHDLEKWEHGHTVGVLNFMAFMLFSLRWPQYYWIFHIVAGIWFLGVRFRRFKQRGWEWYMADFCYVNIYATIFMCLIAYLRVWHGIESPVHKYNEALMHAGFAFSNGSVLYSVVMFGNKLVFHDIDNTCSIYVHFSPGIFMWILRWGGGYGPSLIRDTWGDMFIVCHNFTDADLGVSSFRNALWHQGTCFGDIYEFGIHPMVVYVLLWSIPYYLVVFCCFQGYLERNNKCYLYKDRLATSDLLKKTPEKFRPLAYMFEHFVFTMVSGILSLIFWNSFLIHTCALIMVWCVAINNGSTFMFRQVAMKAMPKLLEKAYNEAGSSTTEESELSDDSGSDSVR